MITPDLGLHCIGYTLKSADVWKNQLIPDLMLFLSDIVQEISERIFQPNQRHVVHAWIREVLGARVVLQHVITPIIEEARSTLSFVLDFPFPMSVEATSGIIGGSSMPSMSFINHWCLNWVCKKIHFVNSRGWRKLIYQYNTVVKSPFIIYTSLYRKHGAISSIKIIHRISKTHNITHLVPLRSCRMKVQLRWYNHNIHV